MIANHVHQALLLGSIDPQLEEVAIVTKLDIMMMAVTKHVCHAMCLVNSALVHFRQTALRVLIQLLQIE